LPVTCGLAEGVNFGNSTDGSTSAPGPACEGEDPLTVFSSSAIAFTFRSRWNSYIDNIKNIVSFFAKTKECEVISTDTFGASTPAGKLFEHFGFTVQHVVDVVKRLVGVQLRVGAQVFWTEPTCKIMV
jgi:hypothetical protein